MTELKRTRRFLVVLIALTVLMGTLMTVNAGTCVHGGENSTFQTYKTVAIGCITTGSHQCYVGGELTSCETYRYKFINYQHCAYCGAEGDSYYSYGPQLHQYNH